MKRTKNKASLVPQQNLSLTLSRKEIFLLGIFSLGIILRYFVMSWGWNYDFESFCIVGQIAGNFRNVYAETSRYNYGSIFFSILALLYKISQIKPQLWVYIFRVLIVTVLTLTDLGIAAFIANKYSWKKALIFFLNPVSIIITGYHNQFDNIAVLFALLSTKFFNPDEKFTKDDFAFVALFSLSLITKHILFILPVFILLMDKLPVKKKIFYAFVPPAIFLVSFIPFALSSPEALNGIVRNVFKYLSFNNAPFMWPVYKLINFPKHPRIIIYMASMIAVAYLTRKYYFENIMMIYLISMVSFSSAIANQYLIIPMAALCVLDVGVWNKIYMAAIGIYLFLEGNGLGMLDYFPVADFYVKGGYVLAAWILFFALVHAMKFSQNRKGA